MLTFIYYLLESNYGQVSLAKLKKNIYFLLVFNNMQNEEKLKMIIDNILFCLSNISVFIPITVSPISNIENIQN